MSMDGEKHNYLEDYITDRFAEAKGMGEIVFDWNRISEVTPIQEVKGWENSPMGQLAKKRGMKVHKYIVECPNPKHGVFTTLLPDEPQPWSYHCYHCIGDEMKRIDSLRLDRDTRYMKQMRGGR